MELHERIAFVRKAAGLTQEQLGEKLHVTGKTVSRWETGAYMPPVEMLLVMSEFYGVSMNELASGQRLEAAEAPAKAEENLTAAMKAQELFQLREQKQFWLSKWQKDHRWTMVLLLIVTVSCQVIAAWNERLDLVAIVALIAVGLAVLLRNCRDDYVEHHLYDDRLE